MKQAELVKFQDAINEAREMWKRICQKNFEQYGDEGSCVLGAGIAVYAVPPRCRNERKITLISAGEVAKCQGSLNWERGKDEVLDFLKEKGLEAFYDCGWMD